MEKRKKQRFTGIVYSTLDDFQYEEEEQIEVHDTLPNNQQRLVVSLDKKARKGKAVTIIDGFVGMESDLAALGQFLKRKCAVGGSAKDGLIVIQGDFRERIHQLLQAEGYHVKMLR